jgi:hypothetical protein
LQEDEEDEDDYDTDSYLDYSSFDELEDSPSPKSVNGSIHNVCGTVLDLSNTEFRKRKICAIAQDECDDDVTQEKKPQRKCCSKSEMKILLKNAGLIEKKYVSFLFNLRRECNLKISSLKKILEDREFQKNLKCL